MSYFGDEGEAVEMPFPNLPAELLDGIVAHVLELNGSEPSPYRPPSTMQQVHYLASIDTRWRTAVHAFLSRHFVMLETSTSSAPAPWLPGIPSGPGAHASYWREVMGSDWDDVKSLRFQLGWLRRISPVSIKALSLDLRVVAIDTIGTARSWNDTQSGQWVLSSAILSRIASSSTTLESIHIRISPHEDQFDLLQDIITKNTLLRDVVVEVDSALDTPSSLL
ncbi:hypothetical protein CF326_g9575 [Tilletia indica]|nr:hypothetical protein CF326_g9575 [Tilletia indica]